ncbi:MAG: c-type cytochrome, partial [candidate division KSB1 bacterium]
MRTSSPLVARGLIVTLLCAGLGLLSFVPNPAGEEQQNGALVFALRPTQKLSSSPELLALGKNIYAQQCAPCHGVDGKGEGEAAYLLYPKPRDFTAAQYRIVSTWERFPTDE